MIYFSTLETLRAAGVMLIFGTFFPLFVTCLTVILKTLKNTPDFLKLAYNGTVVFQEIKLKIKADLKNKAFLFIIDFISVCAFFILFILLSYAFYDGIFRFYFLLIATVSFIFSKKLFKKSEHFLYVVISLMLSFILIVLSIAFLPLKAAVRLSAILFKIAYLPIKTKLEIISSRKLGQKKRQEILKFLQNI